MQRAQQNRMPPRVGVGPHAVKKQTLVRIDTVAPSAETTIDQCSKTTPHSTMFCNVCAHEWGDRGRNAGISAAEVSIYERAGPDPRSSRLGGSKLASRGPQALPEPLSPEPRTPNPGTHPSMISSPDRPSPRRAGEALRDRGANAFGHDRRSALWQVERAVRSSGEMFERMQRKLLTCSSPLRAMTPAERVRADYAGTSLTIGPHPMALCRSELALRGVQRASDLAGRAFGPTRAGRGRRHHAAAAWHCQGVRVPDTRG